MEKWYRFYLNKTFKNRKKKKKKKHPKYICSPNRE